MSTRDSSHLIISSLLILRQCSVAEIGNLIMYVELLIQFFIQKQGQPVYI